MTVSCNTRPTRGRRNTPRAKEPWAYLLSHARQDAALLVGPLIGTGAKLKSEHQLGEQPLAFVPSAVPMVPDLFQQAAQEHDIAILAPLARHGVGDYAPVANVGRAQVDGSRNAQAPRAARGQYSAPHGARHTAEEPARIVEAEKEAQLARLPSGGQHNRTVPTSEEGDPVDGAPSGGRDADQAGSRLLLSGHEAPVVNEHFRAGPFRRLTEVVGQQSDGADVTESRAGGHVAGMHSCGHAVDQRWHGKSPTRSETGLAATGGPVLPQRKHRRRTTEPEVKCAAERPCRERNTGVSLVPASVRSIVRCVSLACLLSPAAMPQSPVLDMVFGDLVDGLNSGEISLDQARRAGLEVFTRPITAAEGYGDGPFELGELPPSLPGNRPTLQGNGTSLRVNGLDAQSCNECHTIVSHDSIPPKLGIGGVGGLVQNALINPTQIDVSDGWHTATGRDGSADFNGRFANPPFLFGGGGVELLAKEMTADLQELLKQARSAPPGSITQLLTKGVYFGFLRTVQTGVVSLDQVQGIGFKENAGRRAEDVLVVRPFGRKGENFSMRDFDRGAMAFHFGLQPTEVVGRDTDADGDGVANEITEAAMTALHVFDVTNPPPFMEALGPEAEAGFGTFQRIGCSGCHRPVMTTRSRYLRLAHPEVPHDPSENVYFLIDLVDVGFSPAPTGGVYVPLFADLKRHAMGPGLAENFHDEQFQNDEFTTARLWGVRDTAPYLHDGRAMDIQSAIVAHGGDAQHARDLFLSLEQEHQTGLIHFLKRLRTPDSPNRELLEQVAE